MSHCPDCGANIDLDADELEEGEIVSCPECSVDLEVVNTHPLELDVVDDEDEDEDLEDEGADEDVPDEDEDDFEDEEENGFH